MTAPTYRKATGPLMFVLLISSLLIALVATNPTWKKAKLRSRSAECAINLEIIAEKQAALESERGGYLGCPRHPAEQPTSSQLWDQVPPCWDTLGFQPGIFLWGQYSVVAGATGWTATCTIDTDADGDVAKWTASDSTTAAADPAFED